MLDLVRKYLSKSTASTAADEGKRVQIATCALFMEMALIDEEFNATEQIFIMKVMQDQYGLSPVESKEIMQLAQDEVDSSVDTWKFAKLINENYNDSEKLKVVELLWELVLADGHLDRHEEYLIKKVYSLLHVDHGDFIKAKLKALKK